MHSHLSHDARHYGRSPEEIVNIAVASGRLNALAITDHDTIQGSLRARDHIKRNNLPLEAILGSEIKTLGGHVIALFIQQDISRNLSVADTIRQIHQQGGVAIAPHPMFSRIGIGRATLGEDMVMEVAGLQDPQVYWDGFEVFSAGAADFARGFPNEEALSLYHRQGLRLGAPIASTDGHGYMVGRGVTAYVGELKQAILDGKTGALAVDPIDREKMHGVLRGMFGEEINEYIQAMKSFFLDQQISRLTSGLAVAVVETNPFELPDLSFLAPEEQQRWRNLRHRMRPTWEASRLAMKLAYSNITGLPRELFAALRIGNQPLEGQTSGPPFIATNPYLHGSLAHIEGIGVGAISTGPIGVDILRTDRQKPRIKAFFERENILMGVDGVSAEDAFARSWVLYEAVVKGSGLGIKKYDLKVRANQEAETTFGAKVVYKGEEHSDWRVEIRKQGDYYIGVAHQLEPDELDVDTFQFYQFPI